MIIALVISILFGGGSLEVFFIDKIEKGVNIYVTDKDRKNELHANFKEYNKLYKSWNKGLSRDLKSLKKQNLDRTVPLSWYEDFFKIRLDQTAEIQTSFIAYRITLQNAINDDEWAQIMELASSAEIKEQEKEEKKEAGKKNHKEFSDFLSQTANENIVNPDSKRELMAAWNILKEEYDEIIETYDNINVEDNEVLVNKYATEEEMKEIGVKLSSIRAKVYEADIVFLTVLKEHTSNEVYKSIMKEFNKRLK